jgi:hypothetical protein
MFFKETSETPHYKPFQNLISAHFADFCPKALSEAKRKNLELFEGLSPSLAQSFTSCPILVERA